MRRIRPGPWCFPVVEACEFKLMYECYYPLEYIRSYIELTLWIHILYFLSTRVFAQQHGVKNWISVFRDAKQKLAKQMRECTDSRWSSKLLDWTAWHRVCVCVHTGGHEGLHHGPKTIRCEIAEPPPGTRLRICGQMEIALKAFQEHCREGKYRLKDLG